MYTESLIRTQKEWAEKSLMLLRELLPLMSVVAQHADWTSDQRETMGSVLTACARSSESALLLCAFGQLWDAELISRSIVEGSLKIAYLLQSRTTFDQRYDAYSNALFEIGLLKDHGKAVEVLSAVPDPQAREWQPIRDMLLSDAEQARIAACYNKPTRRRLDGEWSFTGLLRGLANSNDLRFVGISAMAHGYSIASHLQHADFAGTSLPLERDFRSPERRESIHLAHLARLISDVFTCFILRLAAANRYVGADPTLVANAAERIEAHQRPFRSSYEVWMDIEYETPHMAPHPGDPNANLEKS